MQTTYRLKAREISMKFLKTIKTVFAEQEIEITVKSVQSNHVESLPGKKKKMLEMINDNLHNAPVIAPNIDIRQLIDDAQSPI